MSTASTVELVGAGLLAAVALLLVYTLARYRQQVLHRPAFEFLGAATVVFAASLLLDWLGAPALVRESLQLLASLLYLVVVWRFAAAFVHVEPVESVPAPGSDASMQAEGGGFEDVE